jgi:RNA polymerase sigma factor (sigma-70 family)
MESSASPEPSEPIDLEELYRQHAAAVYAWACLRTAKRLRQWVTPEDLAQEIWARAARAAPARTDRSGPPRAWLFTIGKHVLYEVRRLAERNGGRAASGGTTRLLALDQVPAEITSHTQRLARDDSLQRFLVHVDELDEVDRMLLLHIGFEAMPQVEVAARLHIGYEALAKRWQRLRERVRDWPSAASLVR